MNRLINSLLALLMVIPFISLSANAADQAEPQDEVLMQSDANDVYTTTAQFDFNNELNLEEGASDEARRGRRGGRHHGGRHHGRHSRHSRYGGYGGYGYGYGGYGGIWPSYYGGYGYAYPYYYPYANYYPFW